MFSFRLTQSVTFDGIMPTPHSRTGYPLRMGLNRLLSTALIALSLILLCSCVAQHRTVPVGEVPPVRSATPQDDAYGRQVLALLAQQYPLDRDDNRINRVREITDRLVSTAGAERELWNVYVFVDDNFKNAAATRGNYIFAWTGILKNAQSDAELATVLSHEIGHVLAAHTMPDPIAEASKITSGVTGSVVGEVLRQQGAGILAGIGEAVVKAGVDALIVNPESQRKELEADQIGIFLMARAGYNPEAAVSFWERARSDPSLRGSPLEFLSSHPSSEQRAKRLREMLPEAQRAYQTRYRPSSTQGAPSANHPALPHGSATAPERWLVRARSTRVFSQPNGLGRIVTELSFETPVEVVGAEGRWLKIRAPVEGYLYAPDLTPFY